MRHTGSVFAGAVAALLSTGCGQLLPEQLAPEEGWTCEGDTTMGLAASRKLPEDVLLSCRGSWTCEGHDYHLECAEAESGQGWSCTCEEDGFTVTSFQNEDICEVGTDKDDPAEADRAARNRVNQGCSWDLPIDG